MSRSERNPVLLSAETARQDSKAGSGEECSTDDNQQHSPSFFAGLPMPEISCRGTGNEKKTGHATRRRQ